MAKKKSQTDEEYVFDPVKEAKDGKQAQAVIWSTKSLDMAVEAINQGLELKANLISPNMIVHFVLLLPLVFVILTLARKKKKMTDGDQTMNPPLQEVCLPISIPTYVVWLMKMIAEAQMRMRRMKEASCNSTLI